MIYVEGDASSASYFLALGALGGGPLRVEGVGQDSIQGDVRFAEALVGKAGKAATTRNWATVLKLQALVDKIDA